MAALSGLPDNHVHTFRCGHAGGASRDFVLKAIEVGLAEIAFTDHIPLYFLPPGDRDASFAMREDELQGYVEEVEALRLEFSGKILVRLGLEADYAEGYEDELARWLARARWDLVLGSVHWVAGDWIDAPGSARRFDREGVEPLYREYYRLLAKAAGCGLFDVLTHFDLPKKHGNRAPASIRDAEETALEAVKASGCAVEISSAGLRKPIGELYPEPRLLRRIASKGIPVTFSSDAHAPAEVGSSFDRTLATAWDCGIREFVTFAGRRRSAHALAPPLPSNLPDHPPDFD